MSSIEPMEYNSRLKEIVAVLRKHSITKGVTPLKLREIIEDLGPTFIKLGQIMAMHSDILPKRYCDELMQLCSDVKPMPFEEVLSVIEESYGRSWRRVFSHIDESCQGAASIAQVHRATLKSGEEVVVKVQRRGIYEKMARDIELLRKAIKLMPPVSLKNMADFDLVLDELWTVTRDEMNFLTEASNMEEFARRNKDVHFVGTPKLYQQYTTVHVLVMEYIDGCAVDDKERLKEEGYDLKEIGSKLSCLDSRADGLDLEKAMLYQGNVYDAAAYLSQTFAEVNACYENIGYDIINAYYDGNPEMLAAFAQKAQSFYVGGADTGFNPKFCGEDCSMQAVADAQTEQFAAFRTYLARLLAERPQEKLTGQGGNLTSRPQEKLTGQGKDLTSRMQGE
mgnify:CR=1 FL=1